MLDVEQNAFRVRHAGGRIAISDFRAGYVAWQGQSLSTEFSVIRLQASVGSAPVLSMLGGIPNGIPAGTEA